jgi:protein-S-isoprenylcysteine O-methyltransferase Ste14
MNETKKSFTPGAVILMLFFILVIPLLPVLISQRWDWWEAWVFAGLNIVGFAVSRFLAARRHPDLLYERAKFLRHEDAKDFDKILSPLVGLGGGVMPLIAGLDELFGWSSEFSATLKIVSVIVILAGYVLASYALIENRFFSGMVRIQTDRGHHVITGGPYRTVRHPGYAGSLITYPFIPILLDSWWIFIPAVAMVILLFVRTYLEDNTLLKELPGYEEYAKKVRYRLIPGVW